MATIDKAALIEAAAKAISTYQGSYLLLPDTQQPIRPTTEQTRLAEAAAPVIVAAVLKPLLELHRSEFRSECRLYFCVSCGVAEPCPTVLLLDQIEADVKGGE